MKKNFPNIDFTDSKIISFELHEDNKLIVYIAMKDEQTLKIIFIDTIRLHYIPGNIVSNICEVTGNIAFLEKAIEEIYEKKPESHPYKLFIVETANSKPILQIVAELVVIIEN